MSRTVPIFTLVVIVALAGCLGGIGFGEKSDDTMPTTTEPQPQTEAPATTTVPETTSTSQTTAPTQTASTTHTTTSKTTIATTTQPSTAAQATTVPTQTTARVDTPTGSQHFRARVTKIVDPTTIKIERNGKTQTVDLIGVRVPESSLIHKRALQTTKAQLDHSVVTVVTDPEVASDSDGHQQAVYTGNWLYNTQLLRTGYARVADGEFSKRAEFERKQQEAKQGGYGLWNTTTTTA